jgi:flavodoxin
MGGFAVPSPVMKTLLIVYHSMTGGTRQMAEAAAAGARSESGLCVSLKRASEADAADVLNASGFVFATPENLAAMSGQMKDFFDRVYYAALERLNGRPYAAMICAGSDGRNAAQQIERIAMGWRLKPIAPSLIVCTYAQTPDEILRAKRIEAADLKQCEVLGATLAAGVALGIF